jgi:3-methyladenine DNA glycosylase Tag|tara:strand:- start:2659 stop:2991 length:333 start_codon:yes stop_codon:yes gene_type:complete
MKAFKNFDIKKVAKLNMEDIVKAEGMIKNKPKIQAIIDNAKICLEITKEHQGVMKYMESLHKLHKKDPLFNPSLQEDVQRFNRIGKTTSVWIAYVVTRENNLLTKSYRIH